MSFYAERAVKAIRKPRACDGCGRKIEAGEAALACSGQYAGDFWSATYHPECRCAEVALNDLHGLRGGDDWINLCNDMEWDDWPWLIEEFPAVAARMNITTERFQEVRDEQARCRLAWAQAAREAALKARNAQAMSASGQDPQGLEAEGPPARSPAGDAPPNHIDPTLTMGESE